MKLPRFGLETDPFEPHSGLDPLNHPAEHLHLVECSIPNLIRPIEDAIAANKDSPGQRMFLISGESGTGRTSVARYILAQHIKANDDESTLIHTKQSFQDEDTFDLAFKIVNELKQKVRGVAYDLGLEDQVDILANRVDNYFDNPGNNPERTFLARSNEFLRDMARIVSRSAKTVTLGAIIENIDTDKKLDMCQQLFKECPGAFVMTTLDHRIAKENVIGPFENKGTSIELKTLGPSEVKDLVAKRWPLNTPPPFNEVGIDKAFGDRARSLRRVLKNCSAMLFDKNDLSDENLNWVSDELYITEADMKRVIKSVERFGG